MTEESTESALVEDSAEPEEIPKRRIRRFVAWMVVLVGLAGIAAAAWYGYDFWKGTTELSPARTTTPAPALSDSNPEQESRNGSSEIREIREELARQHRELKRESARLEALVSSRFGTLETWLAELDPVEPKRQSEPFLAQVREVAALVSLADQQLALGMGANRAAMTLASADQLLANLDDPRFYEVRARLSADLNALRFHRANDVHGLFLTIEGLKTLVEALPLAHRHVPDATQEQGETAGNQSWWARAWSTLSALVTIRDHGDRRTRPLLSESEAELVRLRLLLALDKIQVALVRNDEHLFKTSLEEFIQIARLRSSGLSDPMLQIEKEVNTLREVKFPPAPKLSGEALKALRSLENASAARRQDADANPSEPEEANP